MRDVIVNTTPIISLCHIEKLDLLKKLYGTVIIPKAVYDEICVKSDSVAKNELNKSLDWIKIIEIKNKTAKELYKSQLHDGEVEVMILGKEINASLLIIDDKNAKKHAKYLGFNVTGTLGVLIKAKKENYVQSIKPLIDKLLACNIYIDSKIIEYCLKEAGEI